MHVVVRHNHSGVYFVCGLIESATATIPYAIADEQTIRVTFPDGRSYLWTAEELTSILNKTIDPDALTAEESELAGILTAAVSAQCGIGCETLDLHLGV